MADNQPESAPVGAGPSAPSPPREGPARVVTLPGRLADALASSRPASAPDGRTGGRESVQRGDIRLVGPFPGGGGAARLALVLHVDSSQHSAEIMLALPYTEMATEADLVFSPDETGAPYKIVVQTRVHSAVWVSQVGELVGRLTGEDVQECVDVSFAADPYAVSSRTGPPLAGPADSRWEFKKQEITALNRLAADRIAAVFEESDAAEVLEDARIVH